MLSLKEITEKLKTNPSFNSACGACLEARIHKEKDWENHPHAGEGFSREHGSPKPKEK